MAHQSGLDDGALASLRCASQRRLNCSVPGLAPRQGLWGVCAERRSVNVGVGA